MRSKQIAERRPLDACARCAGQAPRFRKPPWIRGYSFTGDVSDVIVYIDISEVREGAVDELKASLTDLADLIEAKEPQLLAYNVYFSDDGTRMTVMNVHPDAASLEYHMEVAGPLFRRFVELVTLSSIHIYGEPTEKALKQAYEKARLLGGGVVEVEALHAGFTRLAAPTTK